MNGYAELHCHTNFSFLDGASHPEDLVERAIDLGYEALAVTDHDGFYGVSRFWQAAKETGLPAIYGVEIGLEPDPAGPSDPVAAAQQWDEHRHSRSKGGQGRLRRGRSIRSHGAKPTNLPETDHLVLLGGSP
ncbi:MAG TPA: PHP domain-containing protein, partial [Acidimicrobiia bacterium]|nr:PHP domain-containing protein [Acidimicrobiia bacterium]